MEDNVNKIFIMLWLTLILSFQFAQAQISDFKINESNFKSDIPAYIPISKDSFKGGFNDLLEFVVPAPYQGNAGSCLFMSHTGVVEWWMNKLAGYNKYDLSERYFMNLQKDGVGASRVLNWKTDTIERLNTTRRIYTNDDFRFTKGWYVLKNGSRRPAFPNQDKAKYGEKFNWIVDYQNLKVPGLRIPKFKREVIFADPADNQWNVNVAPKDIVAKIKKALKINKAPVLMIYNHTGFWHANLIVGYNDNASTQGCPFVGNYNLRMNNRADEIVKEASEATSEREKRKLLRKAKRFRKRGQNVHDAYIANGGCSSKGVFYVRDSIYPNKNMPLYDYDLSNTYEEEHLNAPVILREYEWAERVSNHAIQILLAK